MKKSIDVAAGTVTFTFDEGVEPYVFDLTKLSEANRVYAVASAISHRLGDAAAIARKDAPGFKVTEAMRRGNVAEIGDFLATGTDDWDMKKGPRSAPLNPHILALAEKRNCSYAEAMAWVAAKALEELN